MRHYFVSHKHIHEMLLSKNVVSNIRILQLDKLFKNRNVYIFNTITSLNHFPFNLNMPEIICTYNVHVIFYSAQRQQTHWKSWVNYWRNDKNKSKFLNYFVGQLKFTSNDLLSTFFGWFSIILGSAIANNHIIADY